jgi:hypothetical protein
MNIKDIRFARRETDASSLIGYFADWRRGHEEGVLVIARNPESVITQHKREGAVPLSYKQHAITEQEAGAQDPDIVAETHRCHTQLLREGLLALLGGDPVTHRLPQDAHLFAHPQILFLEAQAIQTVMQELIREKMASEIKEPIKRVWREMGDGAHAYLAARRKGLVAWVNEVILPEVLLDIPEVGHAPIIQFFHHIEPYPFAWDDYLAIALHPRQRRALPSQREHEEGGPH